MSYLDRVRELHKQLSLARDSVTRVEILDRMLFVIEAQTRAWKLQDSSLVLPGPLGCWPYGGTESSQYGNAVTRLVRAGNRSGS